MMSAPVRMAGLELLQQVLRIADFELPGRLHVEGLDHAVVDHHGVALRAHTHAAGGQVELEPERLGKDAAAVRHHAHLARALLILGPRPHHEGVVHRDAPDLVHLLRLELVVVARVPGHVLGRARGRESAGKTEDDDALALGEILDLKGIGADGAARRLRLDHLRQGAVRQLVTNLDRHVNPPGVSWTYRFEGRGNAHPPPSSEYWPRAPASRGRAGWPLSSSSGARLRGGAASACARALRRIR